MELEIHPCVGFSNSTRLAMFESLSKPNFDKIARSTAVLFVGKRIATYCTPHTLTIYLFIIFLSNFITQTSFIHQISHIITLTIFNHKITTPLSHTYF